jgi:hypothetical protein
MKQLPIGFSDYKQLIERDLYYIDKTLLIEDLINFGGLVSLISRPRRFGKTLNMSMLKYFFEKSEKSHQALFEDKKIWKVPQARALQGKFPLIFMTFKDTKRADWQASYDSFASLIADEYNRHKYLRDGGILNENELAIFNRIASLKASEVEYHKSLLYLSSFLTSYHKEKTVILIDEYDTPIQGGLLHDYYDKVTEFMRNFLGYALKDNANLQLGVVTGILRAAKEGIFSGFNNPKIFSVLRPRLADKFGFKEEEIDQLLKSYGLESKKEDFKSWYNGYLIGETKIYNPWSSLCCVDEKGEFRPFWANTSDNALIRKIIASSSPQIKDACAELLRGHTLPGIPIDDEVVLPNLGEDSNSILALLLFSGYLTTTSYKIHQGEFMAALTLPNKELVILFKKLVTQLFTNSLGDSDVIFLKRALQNGDGKLFSELLSKFIVQSMSWHDIAEDEPEKSYHLFVLGLLVVFSESYIVRSNRESGYGRYDILLIPHDPAQLGFVIEFKKKDATELMEKCAERALEQILQKKYATEMQSMGIKKIVLFAIAIHKKEIYLKQENLFDTSSADF